MDLMTMIGIAAGFLLIINGIGIGSVSNFIDISSFLIVAGGTLAASVASYSSSILRDIPGHIRVLFRGNRYDIVELVDQLVDLAILARKDGLLALESKAEEIKEPFFKQSLLMAVDAQEPEKIRCVLEKELEDMALITTFYGSVLANLIFHPIAQKLRVRHRQEAFYCSAVIEGVIGIQRGEHPKFLREHLLAALKKSLQDKALSRLEEKDAYRGDESLLGRKRYVLKKSDFEQERL